MAQDSLKDMDIFESQLRECFGRVAWTHKTQEKAADRLLIRNHRVKLIQIVLSALASTGAVVTILGENGWSVGITALSSVVLLIINTYLKDYDLGGMAQKHAATATDLWHVRESYLSLITDIRTKSISLADAKVRRDELQDALSKTYANAPRTTVEDYDKASQALKVNEELTFSDQEIDALLPIHLRKTAKI